MLKSLQISNVALIDDLTVDFSGGFNALTGETGSGKSIIIDALALTVGARSQASLIRTGAESAVVAALYDLPDTTEVRETLEAAGITGDESGDGSLELLVRREFSQAGRQRVSVNGQLATIAILKRLQPLLVDIHGQGEQQTLFDPKVHLDLLDSYLGNAAQLDEMARRYTALSQLQKQLATLAHDLDPAMIQELEREREAIAAAELSEGELAALEQEKRRLLNTERLSQATTAALVDLYDAEGSALVRLTRAEKALAELGEFEPGLAAHEGELRSVAAQVDDITQSLRSFLAGLEFSPDRLDQLESRLAEIARITRPYGGTIASTLERLNEIDRRLGDRSDASAAQKRLAREVGEAKAAARRTAADLSEMRAKGRERLLKDLTKSLKELGFPHANIDLKLEPLIDSAGDPQLNGRGSDRAEFYFSANKGEEPRKLVEVASGGEASRLMLALKTVSQPADFPRTVVFDEIDSGIGGAISTAVGRHLKKLAAVNQVFSVTHQPQIASFADNHVTVEKQVRKGRTLVIMRTLAGDDRIEEIARMLAGGEINTSAREHARQLMKDAGK
jgi:DNA repair protein RecN (Recombination protein N)